MVGGTRQCFFFRRCEAGVWLSWAGPDASLRFSQRTKQTNGQIVFANFRVGVLNIWIEVRSVCGVGVQAQLSPQLPSPRARHFPSTPQQPCLYFNSDGCRDATATPGCPTSPVDAWVHELEDLLRTYEPSRAFHARELVEAYKGMERELIHCYRHYYTGSGGFCVTSPSNGSPPQPSRRQRTFSLPKVAISVFLREKLRVSRPTKTESVRGVEAPRQPRRRAASLDTARLQRQRAQAGLVITSPRAAELDQVVPLVQVRCLDNGRVMSAEAVNGDVLRFRRSVAYRQPLSFRDRVLVFLQKHDLAAVDRLDEIINYGGRTYEETWEYLQAKYQTNHRGRLYALLRAYEPQNMAKLDELLEHHRGQEEALLATMRAKYRDVSPRNQRRSSCTWSRGAPNAYQLLPQ